MLSPTLKAIVLFEYTLHSLQHTYTFFQDASKRKVVPPPGKIPLIGRSEEAMDLQSQHAFVNAMAYQFHEQMSFTKKPSFNSYIALFTSE